MEPVPQVLRLTPIPASRAQPAVRVQVLKIDPVTVTRDLPPSVTTPSAATGPLVINGATGARPTIEVPGVELDYPMVNVPTQEEFDAAVNQNKGNQNKESSEDAAKARELSARLPNTGALQQVLYRPQLLQQQDFGTGLTLQQPAAPVATPAPKAEQPASPSVTLPFVGTMPLPSKEAMAIATTTAVAATFVAVLGKAAFEASLEGIRPVLRLLLIRYKKLRNRDLSESELQLEFAFEMDKKRKGKRTFGQAIADLKDYLRDNFLEDLIGN
jgi:hypothetical protein